MCQEQNAAKHTQNFAVDIWPPRQCLCNGVIDIIGFGLCRLGAALGNVGAIDWEIYNYLPHRFENSVKGESIALEQWFKPPRQKTHSCAQRIRKDCSLPFAHRLLKICRTIREVFVRPAERLFRVGIYK